jgi:hypothetical protein
VIAQRLRPAAALSGLLLLGACASPGACDPTQADLFSGIGCSVGGGYATRTTDLTQQRNAAQAQQQASVAAQNAAAADSAAAQQELLDRQQQVAALRRQTATMQGQLNAARQRQNVDSTKLAQAQAQLAALQRDEAALPPAPSQEQLQAVQRRWQDLRELMHQM